MQSGSEGNIIREGQTWTAGLGGHFALAIQFLPDREHKWQPCDAKMY